MHTENEKKYLDLLQDVLYNGSYTSDRTGVGTLRTFGKSIEYDISESFPLLTTKKMAWKSIVHELLWFISGDTNIKYLNDNGVKIWNANQQDYAKRRELADLPIIEGDCGHIYGYQWRKFNDGFIGEVDQLKKLCEELKNNPTSRRLLVSAWNPLYIGPLDACLPPCHVLFQLFIDNDELSCSLYQRSADMFLGVPFNIASYSLLTYMIGSVFNLKPKKFVHFIGDCHIYTNHTNQVKEQLDRKIFNSPTLEVINRNQDLFNFKFEDFILHNYTSHPAIKANMAV